MKSRQLLAALRERNRQMQLRAPKTFLELLRTVCQVHSDRPWAIQAREILRTKALSRDSVQRLLSLADSLASQTYETAEEHFSANQFSLLIRKYPFPPKLNPFNPEEQAKSKFDKVEKHIHRINQRFRARRVVSRRGAPFEFEMQRMRDFIRYTIGDCPPLSEILSETGFGPGAAVGIHGNATNGAQKLRAPWTVSPGAYMHGFAAVMNHQRLKEILFLEEPLGFASCVDDQGHLGPYSRKASIVAYNKLAFVPKTAKTHRSIAVEPLLNGFLQKGVDQVFRKRLRRIGIDISDQRPNQEMARIGSDPGSGRSFATIDLASASDSVSLEVVRDLLPPEWFDLLNSLRSKSYLYRRKVYRYEKFCSMGNGFCFPLETLIFTSVCVACGVGRPGVDFRVYGDDIIVPQNVADRVIQTLSYLGFEVNTDKTFLEGPFRESCGADWFNGVDVRPYTLDIPLDSVQDVFKVLNGSLRNDFTRSFFAGVRQFLLSLIPASLRLTRPYPGPEDTAITSVGDEHLSSPNCAYRWYGSHGSWEWKELSARPVPDSKGTAWARIIGKPMMYAALLGSASDMPFSVRRKTRTKVRVISHPGATSQWLPPDGQMMLRR